ncbi:MAG: hypothetical protein B7Y02_03400, partial [Rhodobacterales bacterium 17-64-5]
MRLPVLAALLTCAFSLPALAEMSDAERTAFRAEVKAYLIENPEVLVEAIARWGVEATCRRLVGMFAFAVWDAEADCIWLARDRIGKKPLYYWDSGKGYVFASELKALWAFPGFQPQVNQDALAEYFRDDEHRDVLL